MQSCKNKHTLSIDDLISLALVSVFINRKSAILRFFTLCIVCLHGVRALYKLDNALLDEKQVYKLALWGMLVSCLCGNMQICFLFGACTLILHHAHENAHKSTASIVDVDTLSSKTKLLLALHQHICSCSGSGECNEQKEKNEKDEKDEKIKN